MENHPNERMLNLDFLLWLKCPLRTTATSSGSLNPESLWKDTDFLRLGCSDPSLVTSSTTTMVRSPSWRPSWGSAILEQQVISQNSCADSADNRLPGLYDRSIWWCDVGGSLINYLWNSVWDHLHWVDNVPICHSLKYVQLYHHLHHLDHDDHLEDDDHLDHDELMTIKFVRKLEVVHKEVGGCTPGIWRLNTRKLEVVH